MASQSTEQTSDTRQRLVEAALLAFADKGFDGVGVREIAQNAGANPALIAYHFGNKEGLYEATLQWVISSFFQWLKKMPCAPDPDCPDARSAALVALKANINDWFENIVICNNAGRVHLLHHEAAQKLWSREMASPRTALLDHIIEQIRTATDKIFACTNILRPGLSRLELDTLIIVIHGAIFFFHSHLSVFQQMRGATYSQSDLEAISKLFIDFTLRGLGIPDVIADEGA
jgi:AcrR family transcriptional regulator